MVVLYLAYPGVVIGVSGAQVSSIAVGSPRTSRVPGAGCFDVLRALRGHGDAEGGCKSKGALCTCHGCQAVDPASFSTTSPTPKAISRAR
jgi:hypothetical protein